MKNLTVFLIFFSLLNGADIEKIISNIDDVKTIQSIKEENKKEVKYNPFEEIKKEQIQETKDSNKKWLKQKKIIYENPLILEAVFNKSAFIDTKWYKIGDKINGYEIKDVKETSVLLEKGKKVTKLTLNDEKNSFLEIKDKK